MNLSDPIWDNSTFSKNQERLLRHQAAELGCARVVALAREQGWVSDEYFTADGMRIDARASWKSFQPETGPQVPTGGDAQLARQGRGKAARLCFALHALMQNRPGLCVQAKVTTAHGITEGTLGNLNRELTRT